MNFPTPDQIERARKLLREGPPPPQPSIWETCTDQDFEALREETLRAVAECSENKFTRVLLLHLIEDLEAAQR